MTQRTVNRSLIVHNDFNLGYGQESQTRGTHTAIEQKIELNWIFRTIDEIRLLDIERYTRVSLHTLGPLVEYYFDAAASDADDGDDILAPIPAVSLGRWVKVASASGGNAYASSELADSSHVVNTSLNKRAGFMVFNTTINKPLWATGPDATDTWKDANGTTVHTPS